MSPEDRTRVAVVGGAVDEHCANSDFPSPTDKIIIFTRPNENLIMRMCRSHHLNLQAFNWLFTFNNRPIRSLTISSIWDLTEITWPIVFNRPDHVTIISFRLDLICVIYWKRHIVSVVWTRDKNAITSLFVWTGPWVSTDFLPWVAGNQGLHHRLHRRLLPIITNSTC